MGRRKPKFQNIAIDFHRLAVKSGGFVDIEGLPLDPRQDPAGYADYVAKTDFQRPGLKPGVAQQFFELFERHRTRLPHIFQALELSDQEYFRQLKRKIFYSGRTDEQQIFRSVDLRLWAALKAPWYEIFFRHCAAGELPEMLVWDRFDEIRKLRGPALNPQELTAEEVIFLVGILRPVHKFDLAVFKQVRQCRHCGAFFLGRPDAKFCCDQCRVYSHLARTGQLVPGSKCFPPSNAKGPDAAPRPKIRGPK